MNAKCNKLLKVIYKIKFLLMIVLTFNLYYFGVFTLFFETGYNEIEMDVNENITKYIYQIEKNVKPDKPPFNFYNYSFLKSCVTKCDISNAYSSIRLVFIVKSAIDNFARREAIRKTWGFEKRFSDVGMKTVFILGISSDKEVQERIDKESNSRGDILQADFVDSYFNNTIKTIMGFRWGVTYCNHSKFFFFSDDDMYISAKNILRFLRNPLDYPDYLIELEKNSIQNASKDLRSIDRLVFQQSLDTELPSDTELLAGYLFPTSRPHRHFSSKWYVPLSEYRFSRYPPYLTAGAYVVSRKALKKLYFASFYTKHFRFDDIYLAMLARQCSIVPLHNDEFYFYKKPYSKLGYKYVLAVHGYENPEELLNVWIEQKSLGNS